MNIFVLDKNPVICAKYHCDRHVVKMILESAQMICTVHHLHKNPNLTYTIPYKPTHVNHPCSKWLRDSLANYLWLFQLTKALNDEYKFRYNKIQDHKSWTAIKDLPLPNLKNIGLTRWARAMPIEAKIDNDVIASYHKYYRDFKQHLHKFTKREHPYFLNV